MSDQEHTTWISGFWRRIGALFIDALVLGLIGLALSLLFEEFFIQLGGLGRVVGLVVALAYFGTLNSSIGGGQTIGKKLLKIRVVGANNEPITFLKSSIRYLILGLPMSLNGAQYPPELLFSPVIYLISFIVFGGLFSIPYLYIFNRVTRQSLHDLVVGTYVVNAGVDKQEPGKVWRGHLVVVALIFLTAIVVPAVTTRLAESTPFEDMLAVHAVLSAEPGVKFALVSTGFSTLSSTTEGKETTTHVTAQVFLNTDNTSDVDLARRLAAIVVANYPHAAQMDIVQVVLTYGYDIGIASKWTSYSHSFDPGELDVPQ